MAVNSTVKERILDFAKCDQDTTLEDFLKGIDASYGNFRGKNRIGNISSSVISKIAEKHPHLNLRWLLLGEGDMFDKMPLVGYTVSEIVKYIDNNIDEFLKDEHFCTTCELVKTRKQNERLEKEVQDMKATLNKLAGGGNQLRTVE